MSKRRLGVRKMTAAVLGAALLMAGASRAAVVYDFDGSALGEQSFQFTVGDFITGVVDLEPDELDSCTPAASSAACGAVQILGRGAGGSPAYGGVGVSHGGSSSFYYFAAAAFDMLGPQASLTPGIELTVANAPAAAVPEPSAWALMLVGVFALGGAVRRGRLRRRHLPEGSYTNVPILFLILQAGCERVRLAFPRPEGASAGGNPWRDIQRWRMGRAPRRGGSWELAS